jgi:general stress protein 26
VQEEFENKIKELWTKMGKSKIMVLATSKENKVTARMMSCVIIDEAVYFQTDKTFIKYEQITANPFVALCVDNIQIEGVATVIGSPLASANSIFADAFQQYHKGSFDAYSHLKNETVIQVTAQKITIWEYEADKPFRAVFDISNHEYSRTAYIGE